MKYSKKRLQLMTRLALVGGVFLGLFLLGYYTGFLRENCGSDVPCFTERARECRPTDVIVVQANNAYGYSVRSSIGDCSVHVILERVEAGAPAEFQALEGKRMICAIPKKELDGFSLDQFDAYMPYCHGLLKEGLYEIVLKRVYSNLLGHLSGVVQEAERVLRT